jgi:hypothetical protein
MPIRRRIRKFARRVPSSLMASAIPRPLSSRRCCKHCLGLLRFPHASTRPAGRARLRRRLTGPALIAERKGTSMAPRCGASFRLFRMRTRRSQSRPTSWRRSQNEYSCASHFLDRIGLIRCSEATAIGRRLGVRWITPWTFPIRDCDLAHTPGPGLSGGFQRMCGAAAY